MATTGKKPWVASPAAEGHGVLLGDAHVEHPVGELLGGRVQAGAVGHGRGHRHHPRIVPHLLHQGLAEDLGVAGSWPLARSVGGHPMPAGRVLLGRAVAVALLGEDVDDGGLDVGLGPLQRLLQGRDVMSIHGAHEGESQLLPQQVGQDQRLQAVEDLAPGAGGLVPHGEAAGAACPAPPWPGGSGGPP